MSIATKLTYLNETKTNIKNAIIEKGVEVSDSDTFRSYASKIADIEPTLGTKTITANGTYTATDDRLQGYSSVTVDIDDTDLYRDTTDSTYESVKTLSNCGAFPMLSLTAEINAVQDLHGYDKPWAGGAGKNKFKTTATSKTESDVTWTVNSDGSITVSGTATGYTSIGVGEARVQSSMGKVTISGISGITNLAWGGIDLRDENDNTLYTIASGSTYESFTVDLSQYPSAYKISMTIKRNNNGAVSGIIKPQVELGETVTPFEPYSNICPISGWDEVNVNVSGVNVWDEEWELGAYNSTSGLPEASSFKIRTKNYISVKPNERYRVILSDIDVFLDAVFYDKDKNIVQLKFGASGGIHNGTVLTMPSNCYYFRFGLDSAYGSTYSHDISINYPSTDTEYHAYNGQNYNITLSDTQDVVYYGALNLITGEGQITHKKKVLDGTQSILTVNWLPTSNGVGWIYPYSVLEDSKIVTSGTPNMLCDTLKVVNYNSIYQGGIGITLYYSTYASICLRQTDTSLTTKELINAYLAENPIEVVYELATPITFNVTPIDLTLAEGVNNIWANSGDVGDARYFKKVEL